jgi:hypothetical protein
MIEATLEGKFRTAISAAITTYPVTVAGFWQTESKTGAVAFDELPVILVSIAPAASTAQAGDKRYEAKLNIEIISTVEDDQRKVKLAYWADRVSNLLETIKGNHTTLSGSTYSQSGVYTLHGLSIDGGEVGFNDASKTWFCSNSATLSYCKA